VLSSQLLEIRPHGFLLFSAFSVEMTRYVLAACHFVVQMELCRLYSRSSSEDLYRVFLKNETFCMDKAYCLHVR
jgi:hypothetical protein